MLISELQEKIKGIEAIPANEQHIGHFQMATIALLIDMSEEIAKLQKLCGTFRG
jgi:hypothetical protein